VPPWKAIGCEFRLMKFSGNSREPVGPAIPPAQEAGRPSGLAENCSLEPFIGSLTFLRNTVQNGSLPNRRSVLALDPTMIVQD
jgi:hypothetical protein